MNRNVIVVFQEGKQPRILHNVDPNLFDSESILINPVLPPGIPPHRWAKGAGSIVVLPESEQLQALPALALAPSKAKLSLKHYIMMGLTSLIISLLLKLLMH